MTMDSIYSWPIEWGKVNQLRRASISIPSNIAEGSSRGKKEFVHFINMSLGSCYECVPLLEVAKKQNYVDEESFETFIDSLHRISAKISALKKSIQK
jgi:four helix bundle protein